MSRFLMARTPRPWIGRDMAFCANNCNADIKSVRWKPCPRTTFDVAILDGTNPTTVDRQGHGFQRTLLISALQLLAQSGAAAADGVICLAVEEPELFQHPIQAQTFAKV